jgi:hypothetical protein
VFAIKKKKAQLGTSDSCPTYFRGWDQEDHGLRVARVKSFWNSISTHVWVWWCMPLIPATQGSTNRKIKVQASAKTLSENWQNPKCLGSHSSSRPAWQVQGPGFKSQPSPAKKRTSSEKDLFFFFSVLSLELRATPWTTPPALSCSRFCRDRVWLTICLGWLWTLVLLISSSRVARITGRSHWHLAWKHF